MTRRASGWALALSAVWLVAGAFPGSAVASSNCSGYFLSRAPFVHPLIIEDLETWQSDHGEQVVAINVAGSMDTNRYYGAVDVGDTSASHPAGPSVTYMNADACGSQACVGMPPYFSYGLVGRTKSGLYVLWTSDGGGGSGRFENLLIVRFREEMALSRVPGSDVLRPDRKRCVIERLAQIILGDRYTGRLAVEGDTLLIGKDHRAQGAGLFPEDTRLVIEPPVSSEPAPDAVPAHADRGH